MVEDDEGGFQGRPAVPNPKSTFFVDPNSGDGYMHIKEILTGCRRNNFCFGLSKIHGLGRTEIPQAPAQLFIFSCLWKNSKLVLF